MHGWEDKLSAASNLSSRGVDSSLRGNQVSNSAACVFATCGSMFGGDSRKDCRVSDAHGAHRRVCMGSERSNANRLVKLSNQELLDEHAKCCIDYQIDQIGAELIQACQS